MPKSCHRLMVLTTLVGIKHCLVQKTHTHTTHTHTHWLSQQHTVLQMSSAFEFYGPEDALVPRKVISYLMAFLQFMDILLKAVSARPSKMSSKKFLSLKARKWITVFKSQRGCYMQSRGQLFSIFSEHISRGKTTESQQARCKLHR